MTRRSSRMLTAAVGLWLANPVLGLVSGQTPTGAPASPVRTPALLSVNPETSGANSANQRVADAIAERLRQHSQLQNYHIEIAFNGSTAELTGHVAAPAQKEEAVQLVQSVAGVVSVRDLLTVAGASVTRATAIEQAPQEPGQLGGQAGVPGAGAPTPSPGVPQEPVPLFQAPAGATNASAYPPPLPPYAWPTFAPYNNYSRVAYPTLYPYQAWPYIGPMYPFPKVPLGWRSVKLTYYDGHWWFGKRATGHDWWRVRYW